MKSYRFNNDWEFTLDQNLDTYNFFGIQKMAEAIGAPAQYYEHSNWSRVTLPHDWAVALPKNLEADTITGSRATSHYSRFHTEKHNDLAEVYNLGWYRKSFPFDPAWEGKRVFIEFEGVFRDATVWVNGVYLDRHFSGYTSFIFELTDHLHPGEDNSIAVRVDTEHYEGWFYEGAGIYRNVNILVGEPTCFKHWETVVKANVDGSVQASAILENDSIEDFSTPVVWEILDKGGNIVARQETTATIPAGSSCSAEAQLQVDDPELWDLEHPNLYRLRITAGDVAEETFGFRSVEFDPDKGCLLNGKAVKLHGACVHQDLGGVGVALTDNLNRYKIQRLKDMGVNAYRTSHNAPSPALLKACDELGMLVMDETRMFGSSPEAFRQFESLIKRDRNHPSVIIWSIGNEEFTVQSTPWGERVGKKMVRLAAQLDDTRVCTYGGNNGTNYDGINASVPVRGINYIRNGGLGLDEYHRQHPHQAIFGSEEASFVCDRGSAIVDYGSGIIGSDGNMTMKWGSTAKGWVKFYEERPWFMGGFMWTGFDYRGEPVPYQYSSFSSYFAPIDLCGMAKPPYYYYKAWWVDEPLIKLTPHWNHKAGQEVNICCFTNCEHITLRLNGEIVAECDVEKFDAPQFKLTYIPGTLEAEGIKDGKIYRDVLRTSGEAVSLVCTPVLACETKDDIGIIQVEAQDKDGNLCPVASNMVSLSIQNGTIVGVGNGDAAWDGLEQIPDGEEVVHIRNFGVEHNGMEATWAVPPTQPNSLNHTARWEQRHSVIWMEPKTEGFEDDFRLVDHHNYKESSYFDPKTYTYTANFTLNKDFDYIEFQRLHGEVRVYLDGEEIGNNLRGEGTRGSALPVRPYRFRCAPKKGEHQLKVVTTLKDNTMGAMSGYVKIGRAVPAKWQVPLHFGLARVFVKGNKDTVLTAQLAE